MSTQVRKSVMSGLRGLRHEPTAKRIRAKLGEHTVVDSTRAVLLWEPRRIVATWAVPVEDVAAELTPTAHVTTAGDDEGAALPSVSERPVLDPSVPFVAHTADGEAVDIVSPHGRLTGRGLRLDDPDLAGYVALDFAAFDSWWEEDEQNIAHPRDPFHRIDILHSSRHVRVELDGEVLAESTRPYLLFETMLPTRFYFPREDAQADLAPSETHTLCAYKGQASYFSPLVGGREIPDLAWTYPAPLREATEIAGMVAFFNERVDLVLDGVRQERPITQWSRGAAPATGPATRSARA
jgi:uncharacterized protein (DUF427 family)